MADYLGRSEPLTGLAPAFQSEQAQPSRESHVAGEVIRLGNRIDELQKHISILRSRLSPILRVSPPAPTNGTTATKQTEALVPLAAKLRECSAQILDACHCLDDLHNSLEI